MLEKDAALNQVAELDRQAAKQKASLAQALQEIEQLEAEAKKQSVLPPPVIVPAMTSVEDGAGTRASKSSTFVIQRLPKHVSELSKEVATLRRENREHSRLCGSGGVCLRLG